MKSITKYTLLGLVILDLGLIVLNNHFYYYHSVVPKLDFAKFIFGIGILIFILYLIKKTQRKFLTWVMIFLFGISLILNFILLVEYYDLVQQDKRISQYYELKDHNEIKRKFEKDLENREIVYFDFGIYSDKKLKKKLKKKYDIDCFSMGCLVLPEMTKYNELVEKYIKEKYNEELNDSFIEDK